MLDLNIEFAGVILIEEAEEALEATFGLLLSKRISNINCCTLFLLGYAPSTSASESLAIFLSSEISAIPSK